MRELLSLTALTLSQSSAVSLQIEFKVAFLQVISAATSFIIIGFVVFGEHLRRGKYAHMHKLLHFITWFNLVDSNKVSPRRESGNKIFAAEFDFIWWSRNYWKLSAYTMCTSPASGLRRWWRQWQMVKVDRRWSKNSFKYHLGHLSSFFAERSKVRRCECLNRLERSRDISTENSFNDVGQRKLPLTWNRQVQVKWRENVCILGWGNTTEGVWRRKRRERCRKIGRKETFARGFSYYLTCRDEAQIEFNSCPLHSSPLLWWMIVLHHAHLINF